MLGIEAKKVLQEKGIHNLYHANSVVTSLTFINNGGLLSRQQVETRGLVQTKQYTDQTDKEFGIYNDIFFDTVDIHERAKNVNHYGPVLFVYSLDVLNAFAKNDIGITKENPIHWTSCMSEKERYFSSYEEAKENFLKNSFGQHVTIRNCSTPISLDCVEEIIIDNPGKGREEYLEQAINAICDALQRQGLLIKVSKRNCPKDCRCKAKYEQSDAGYTYFRFTTKL